MEYKPSTNEGWEESDDFNASEELFGAIISKLEAEDYVYDKDELVALFVNVDTAKPYKFDDAIQNAIAYLEEKGLDFDELLDEDFDVDAIMIEEQEYRGGDTQGQWLDEC